MNTKLLYMEHMDTLSCSAKIKEVISEEKCTIILDQTVFYPQGGGQPYDTGTIKNDTSTFTVKEVRFIDGDVHHIGTVENGEFCLDDKVTCVVDEERRSLNTRLHSAGHIVDMGLKKLDIPWTPGKGYHFPDGPYVEYEGSLDESADHLREQLEKSCNEIIESGLSTQIRFMDKDDMSSVCQHVPDYLPENKPARVVMYGNFGVPCGGTHVSHLNEVDKLTIRKIKRKKGIIRVSYNIT